MSDLLLNLWCSGCLVTLGFVVGASKPRSTVEVGTLLGIAVLWPAFLAYTFWPTDTEKGDSNG